MFFCCPTRLSLGVTLHLEFFKAARGVLRFAKRGQLCPALVVRHLWGRDGWFFNFLEQFGQNMAQFLQTHRKHVLEVRGGESQKIMDYDYDFRWSDFNFIGFFFPIAYFFPLLGFPQICHQSSPWRGGGQRKWPDTCWSLRVKWQVWQHFAWSFHEVAGSPHSDLAMQNSRMMMRRWFCFSNGYVVFFL